jgi:hypothetical protein
VFVIVAVCDLVPDRVIVLEADPVRVFVFEGDRDPVCDEVPVFVNVFVAVLEAVSDEVPVCVTVLVAVLEADPDRVTVFVDVTDETTSVVGVTDTDAVWLDVDVVDLELV